MAENNRDGRRLVLTGNPVSQGIAVARAYVYGEREPEVCRRHYEPGREAEKLEGFHRAVGLAKEELARLAEESDAVAWAEILQAHCMILEDHELLLRTESAVREERLEPEAAVEKVFEEFAGLLAQAVDPLIAARSADIRDVKKRLIRICQGREERRLSRLEQDVIVVAKELLPGDTAALDPAHVKGIVTEDGGCNSHSAILARSHGIPAVAGVADVLCRVPHGALLALDAVRGQVILEPSEEELDLCRKGQEEMLRKRSMEDRYLSRPGATKDGVSVEVGINVESARFEVPGEHYDYIGLLRTEFLYMGSSALPSEEEQFQAYKQVLIRAGGKPVTLRTLDIGGDKRPPCLWLPKEENPFLGNRALRLCFARPELFMTQLRAALRASAYGDLWLMFPMAGGIEDIRLAKSYVREAMARLEEGGLSYNPHIRLGIMVEVPSVALTADLAAEEVDFASVGTNDLTQYVCAADRTNREAAAYYRSYSPAMLRLLEEVFAAFGERNKSVSVCGEMAGSPQGAVLLTGLGARKLSMSPACLAGVKAALAKITLEEARALAHRCRQLKTQEEILDCLGVGH